MDDNTWGMKGDLKEDLIGELRGNRMTMRVIWSDKRPDVFHDRSHVGHFLSLDFI